MKIDQGSMLEIQTASHEDLPQLTTLVMDRLSLQSGFTPQKGVQEKGLSLILDNPTRGRIFFLRDEDVIFGMINVLFTLSTSVGGMVILLEDVVVHPNYRSSGFGSKLLTYVIEFAKERDFKQITLLTDKTTKGTQLFFEKHGFVYAETIPMHLSLATKV